MVSGGRCQQKVGGVGSPKGESKATGIGAHIGFVAGVSTAAGLDTGASPGIGTGTFPDG